MNNIVIVLLLVIVVVLIYVLYKYFSSSNTSLTNSQQNLSTSIPSVDVSKLDNPSSVNYTYNLWLYVNTWNNNPKTIFTRNNNISLTLDQQSPILYCTLQTTTPNNPLVVSITDNFPIQKWMFISIIVYGNFCDFYLNGKLVKSVQSNNIQAPDSTSSIQIGDPTNPFDAWINYFQRWSSASDPQTIWNTYINSYGKMNTTGMSTYHANLVLFNNNVQQSSTTLF